MKTSHVALRISRRAMAAATIEGDGLAFHDRRHLSSNTDRARRAVERYLTRILELTKPQVVVIDAPAKDGSLTRELLDLVLSALSGRGIQAQHVSVADVLSSYGLPGLRTRTELRQVVEPFWPELADMKAKVKAYVAEAAAVALYVDIREGLGVPQPA